MDLETVFKGGSLCHLATNLFLGFTSALNHESEVTRIQSICDVFNKESSLKKFLTDIHRLLKLYLMIPVTTVSSEWSFSALKCVKSYVHQKFDDSKSSKPFHATACT